MASVQQLHTVEPAADPAKAEQQSRSVSQSVSETSGKHPRAGSTNPEADTQHKQPSSAEAQAEGLSSCRAASGSGLPGAQTTEHASRSEPRLHTGIDAEATSVAPAKSELHPDITVPQSQTAGQSGANAAGKLTSVKEYYVKWKGKSYLHCCWVRHDDVLKVARHSAGLNMRFRNYQRSVDGMPQVSHRRLPCHLLRTWDQRDLFQS